MANVTPNFSFYSYGVDAISKEGKMIDSRRRRQELFRLGLFHPADGLLARLGMSKKEADDLERVIFFQGSFLFSARKIPGLDKPRTLVGEKLAGEEDMAGGQAPVSDNGDSLRVMMCQRYTAPAELIGQVAPAASAAAEASGHDPSSTTVTADCRCSGCTNGFGSLEALLNHCRITGHAPVYGGGKLLRCFHRWFKNTSYCVKLIGCSFANHLLINYITCYLCCL